MKLSTQSEAIREAKAIEVFRLVNEGESVHNACQEVGITERQYYYWISRTSSAIEEIKRLITDQERETISEIASARAEALKKISESVFIETNISKLMAIEAHLRGVQREIETRHGMSSLDTTAADFMLTGPSTNKEESRTSITVEPSKKGIKLNISSPEIIDLSMEDEQHE